MWNIKTHGVDLRPVHGGLDRAANGGLRRSSPAEGTMLVCPAQAAAIYAAHHMRFRVSEVLGVWTRPTASAATSETSKTGEKPVKTSPTRKTTEKRRNNTCEDVFEHA